MYAGSPRINDEDHCYRCHGEKRVPVTEVQPYSENENRLVTRWRQVIVGWEKCPACGEEEKP